MKIPTVHLNGTGKGQLQDQIADVLDALESTLGAMRDAWPNGRDYYVQGDGALQEAVQEHQGRIAKVQRVRDEFLKIAQGIEEQC